MTDYPCCVKGCKAKASDFSVAGVDLCNRHYDEISAKLGGVRSLDPEWLSQYAKFLKPADADYVKAFADSRRVDLGSDIKPKKTTAVPTKTKTIRKTTKTTESQVDFKRRNEGIGDDVAKKLRSMDTFEEMAEYARQMNAREDKLKRAEADFNNGVNAGLIRMRIGNLIRGAIARGDAPSPTRRRVKKA